jgi:hypothetical protein
MRPLALLGLLFLSPILHAAASVRLFSHETRLTTARTSSIFIQNDGTEAIVDAVLGIELNPGLEFSGTIHNDGGWTCVMESEREATCRLPSLEILAHHGFFFTIQPARGGHFNLHATASGRNLTAKRLTLNVVGNTHVVVTTPSDFGAGSLRAAIEAINADDLCGTSVLCTISFAGPMTIAPATPLPAIRKCNVEISGGDGIEPQDQPKPIVISGENATWGNGLEVRASCADEIGGVNLHSLVVHSWPWNGIYFEAPAAHGERAGVHSIGYSYIGTNAMGLEARPNRGRGVVTDSPHERLLISQTVISGNGRSGVALFRGERVSIVTGKIGINRYHQPLGNGASGIFSFGVPVTISSSIVAYNAHAGVALARDTPSVFVEFSELHSNGGLPIDWALDDRNLPDDESDRILNAPRILDATYDPADNATRVRGTVRVRRGVFGGDVFTIQSYVASSARGDVVERIASGHQRVEPPPGNEPSDQPFEILIAGDHRGRLIAVQTFVAFPQRSPHLSSEISEAVEVR